LAAITNANNSPTEYGSKIIEYESEFTFCGFIDSIHIVLASVPISSAEKFDNVLQLACPIPETGISPFSDSALIIPEMYVALSVKFNPFEFTSSKFSDTIFSDPVIALIFLLFA